MEKAKEDDGAGHVPKVVVEQALLAVKPGLAGALGKLADAQNEERRGAPGCCLLWTFLRA